MAENTQEQKGRVISVWMQVDVAEALDKSARQLGRTRSWLINMAMREKLGMPPDDSFKGKDKL
jgi:metal-responsive CopG/Arc/MetJ family transcriptional regulator